MMSKRDPKKKGRNGNLSFSRSNRPTLELLGCLAICRECWSSFFASFLPKSKKIIVSNDYQTPSVATAGKDGLNLPVQNLCFKLPISVARELLEMRL